MGASQTVPDRLEMSERVNLTEKQRKNDKLTTLLNAIREKQNALFQSYHEIVLTPIIWSILANFEASINDGCFETLLQILKTYVEIEAHKISNPQDPVGKENLKNAKMGLLSSIDAHRRHVSSYSRTVIANKEMNSMKKQFVFLINEKFPQKNPISDQLSPDECIEKAKHAVEDGESALGRWCQQSEIAELSMLVLQMNGMAEVTTIALPKTPLQNAKIHPSLTIMMKNIDLFEPFLKTILEKSSACNERIQCDLYTPLQYAIRNQNESFFEWLLEQESLDVNSRNKQMKTALFMLCEQTKAAREIRDPKEKLTKLKALRKKILRLLERGADFNISSSKILPFELLAQHRISVAFANEIMQSEEGDFLLECETVMQAKLGGKIFKPNDKNFTIDDFGRITIELLEIFLRFNYTSLFERKFQDIKVSDSEVGKMITLLLHTAVELDLQMCVELIIGRYGNVIFATSKNPSHLKYRVELKGLLRKACDSGNASTLKKLLHKMDRDKLLINDECILVYTLHNCSKLPDESERKQKLLNCAKLMASDPRIFHTKTDCYGNTSLQIALKYGFLDVAKALTVDHRYLYLGVQNKKGETPLDFASLEFCSDYFDRCLSQIDSGDVLIDLNGISPFAYKKSQNKIAKLPKARHQKITTSENFNLEMTCLEKMASSKNLQSILHHPALCTFIQVKWLRYSMWHCVNFLLTLATACVFSSYSIQNICNGNFWLPFYIASWCGFGFILIRELLQYTVLGKNYIWSMQNCLDIAHLVGIFLVMAIVNSPLLTSLVVIMFAIQIIQLFGSLPFSSFSPYRHMFWSVALSFIKSLALFSPLMLAFAFSFFVFYNSRSMTGSNSTNMSFNTFDTVYATGVKILVMASGEFEASSMNLDGNIVIIFILFLLCVPMVIQNLINGLAVSDISQIRKESEFISLREEVYLLAQFESGLNRNSRFKLIGNMLKYLRNIYPGMFFNNYHHIIKIVMNDGAKIMIDPRHPPKAGSANLQSCLTGATEPRPEQTIIDVAAIPTNSTDVTPTLPLTRKQKQSKDRWKYVPKFSLLGKFSPTATVDKAVLEDLKATLNQSKGVGGIRPRTNPRK